MEKLNGRDLTQDYIKKDVDSAEFLGIVTYTVVGIITSLTRVLSCFVYTQYEPRTNWSKLWFVYVDVSLIDIP